MAPDDEIDRCAAGTVSSADKVRPSEKAGVIGRTPIRRAGYILTLIIPDEKQQATYAPRNTARRKIPGVYTTRLRRRKLKPEAFHVVPFSRSLADPLWPSWIETPPASIA